MCCYGKLWKGQETKKEIEIKKAVRYCDLIFWVSFALMLGTRFLTLANFSFIHKESGVEIREITKIYEANPIAKLAINLEQVNFMLFSFVLPAIGAATYFYFRGKVKRGKVPVDGFVYIMNFSFFVALTNIFNDLSVFFGKWLGGS